MKTYIRPEIVVADQLAEGVYMMSGDNPVALTEALDAAIEGGEGIENNDADDMTGVEITEGTDGDIIAGEGVLGENQTAEDTTVTDPVETSAAAEETQAVDVVQESGEMQSSMQISCDSKYMDGIWQAPQNGSWGGLQLGCKEVWGCKDCPADKGNGCGLQDSNADSLYFYKSGSLMPGWQASGKLPTDSPYGF